jgi:hypothetical protein
MKPKVLIVVGIFAFILLVCVGLFVLGSIVTRQQAELDKNFAEIIDVCRGQSAPSAAAYTPGGGRNLLMAIEPNTSGDLTTNTYAIPEDMLAAKAGEVTLVLCLGREREVLIESCPYHKVKDTDGKTDNVIERYAYERDLKLVVAQTGEVLAEEALRGPEPDKCLETQSFKEGETLIKRKGTSISNGDLREWVRQFIAAQ